MVAGFYGALVVLAFFWHALAQDSNDLWHLAPGQPWHASAWGLLLGAAFGQAVVVLFRRLEPHARWLPELHREFRAIFGRPGAHVICTQSDDGHRLYFNGRKLVGNWDRPDRTRRCRTVRVRAGWYPIMLEHHDITYGAFMRVQVGRTEEMARTVPADDLCCKLPVPDGGAAAAPDGGAGG